MTGTTRRRPRLRAHATPLATRDQPELNVRPVLDKSAGSCMCCGPQTWRWPILVIRMGAPFSNATTEIRLCRHHFDELIAAEEATR